MARFPWQKKKEKHIEIGRPTGGSTGYTLASDHNMFASDPAAYLTNNACSLAGNMKTEGMGDPVVYCFDISSQTPRGRSYMPVAGKRLGARLCSNPLVPMTKIIQVEISDHGKNFAFLPWEDDGCTAMVLPSTADYVLTGPLSGCHVYLATSPGKAPLLFHANSNSTGGDLDKNIVSKDNDAVNLAAKMGYTIKKRVARGEYGGMAFVWGKRAGDSWSIYVHQTSTDGKFSNWPIHTI